ncbi:MAG: NAD(P)-dependent oxidoreductase, partial [Oscillochloris sp.]|nr:NAD(P)-dependent oxidoreductase [Oscillochloris sp.]
MNILITGGTGFLGRHVAQLLLRQGHLVQLMGRNFTDSAALLTAGAVPVPVDLYDYQAVINACAGVDAVVNAGALS